MVKNNSIVPVTLPDNDDESNAILLVVGAVAVVIFEAGYSLTVFFLILLILSQTICTLLKFSVSHFKCQDP